MSLPVRPKVYCLLCMLSLVALLAPMWAACADTSYSFQPTPVDLWDLDHAGYYAWGLDWKAPTGQVITGASLFFDNIDNWATETNKLWINLIDEPALGVTTFTDNEAGTNAFSGKGILLSTYSDSSTGTPIDLTYNFTSSQVDTLKQYAAAGTWGIGLDPDCHYNNDGIKLTVTTKPIPEPGTWALMLSAMGAVGVVRRRRVTAK
jgi:hypothetical protein